MRCEAVNAWFSEKSGVIWVNRIASFIAIALGIAEIAVGSLIYSFLVSLRVGAWWAGVGVLLIAILQLGLEKSPTVFVVGCLSVLALLVAMIGAIVDGIFWNVLDHTRGCYNPYSNQYFGDSDYSSEAIACTTTSEIGNPDYRDKCYCVQAGTDFCFHYSLANDADYNCGDILSIYRDWLSSSTIICVVLTIGSLVYCILICTGGCIVCRNNAQRNNQELAPGSMNAGTAPTIVGPGGIPVTIVQAVPASSEAIEVVSPVIVVEAQSIQNSKQY